MRKVTGVLVLLTLLLLGWAWLAPRPLPSDVLERVQALVDAGQVNEAEPLALAELERTPGAPTARLVAMVVRHEVDGRRDMEPRLEHLAQQGGPVREAALYALAQMASWEDDYGPAAVYLKKLKTRHQPYVANSYGVVLLRSGDAAEAEKLFREELTFPDGNWEAAVANLEVLYLDARNFNALEALARDPKTGPQVSVNGHVALLLQARPHWPGYLQSLVSRERSRSTFAWTGALLIGGMWIYLLWRIDAFETEPLGQMLLVGAFDWA